MSRDGIVSTMTHGQSIMTSPYKGHGTLLEAKPEVLELGKRFWELTAQLLSEGKIQPPIVELRQGWDGVLSGIESYRSNSVSGRKIVSRLP